MKIGVIGGGVVGLLSAYQLQRAGHDVAVFERDRIGAGASTGNACLVNPASSFPVPAPGGIPMALKSLTGQSSLRVRPHLRAEYLRFLIGVAAASNAKAFNASTVDYAWFGEHVLEAYDRLDETGLEYEHTSDGLMEVFRARDARDHYLEQYRHVSWMAPKVSSVDDVEITELEPSLDGSYRYGVWTEEARQINPTSLMEALKKAIIDDGGEVREQTTVLGFARGADGKVVGVRTSSGVFDTDRVVVAAGYTSSKLLRELGLNIPMEGGKGYSFDCDAPGHGIRGSVILEDTHIALSVFGDRLRITSFMEFGGDTRVDPKAIDFLDRGFRAAFPNVKIASRTEGWAGFRPMTPDGMPVLGFVPGAEQVLVVTGHSMLGLSMGAITGETVRDLIDGRIPATDIPPRFQVSRYV